MNGDDTLAPVIDAAFDRIWSAMAPLSPRKQVLAYVAFARRFDPLFTNDVPRTILATAECVADCEADLRVLSSLVGECLKHPARNTGAPLGYLADDIACELGFYARRRSAEVAGVARPNRSRTAAGGMVHTMLYWLNLLKYAHPEPPGGWFECGITALLGLCGDLNETPGARLDPRCVSDDVARLATVVYDSRAFSRLPELADALVDAGCADADVLGHCRGPGPHVRGCWVVDLVLGKG